MDEDALEDVGYWVGFDRKKALRLLRIFKETLGEPFGGIGKPEPLKNELAGCWSKRLDEEHRVVYRVHHDKIEVLACRYHY